MQTAVGVLHLQQCGQNWDRDLIAIIVKDLEGGVGVLKELEVVAN